MADAKKCDVCGAFGDSLGFLAIESPNGIDLCDQCCDTLQLPIGPSSRDRPNGSINAVVFAFRELLRVRQQLTAETGCNGATLKLKIRCCGHFFAAAFCPHCGKSIQPKLRPGEPLYWDSANDCYAYNALTANERNER